ncbi:D-alanyl-D-alanine carboxypeptidase-like protein [Knoellia remsis]|uniref:D-alanyl-D-alanine carboxypeptidase-like protein n=1 Tax=Knoellia remsis TaxID=407159 RepID=A0A2T0V0F7_9MICO|nr:M15 family metallopeptidase [Knoellia remsis]PRY63652.1 D-alanyl-D-alanine carboxypeptidase-like protein [Knoellia remsis]
MRPTPAQTTRQSPARAVVRLTVALVTALFIGVAAMTVTARDGVGDTSSVPTASGAGGVVREVGVTSRDTAPPAHAPGVHSEKSSVTTVFDSDDDEVVGLDADLRGALRRAAADAATEGVRVELNSGWRTPEQQRELLDDAIDTYGSKAEAARWVATPEASAHVSGDAVDIGPTRGATWFARHGAAYGLCQTYRNEPWHFELLPDAVTSGCPRMYDDPTQDPRMQ